MDLLAIITTAVAGVSVVLIALGARQLALAEQERVGGRVRRSGRASLSSARLGPDVSYRAHQTSSKLLTRLDEQLGRFGWAERTRQDLRRGEVHLLLFEYYGARVLLGVVGAAIVVLAWGSLLSYFVAVLVGLALCYVPAIFLRRRIDRRLRMIEQQLDGALTTIASTVRSGFSFLQACQLTVTQLRWPLRDEMEAVLEETNLGVPIEEALQKMGERLQNYEVDIVVNAVLINRAVGGSLAEILDSVARTIRDRRELRGHLMSLTAQQRLSAVFVAGVPLFMGGLLSLTSWEFMHPLFTTTIGNVLMAVGIVFDILGFLVMRRLTRIDF